MGTVTCDVIVARYNDVQVFGRDLQKFTRKNVVCCINRFCLIFVPDVSSELVSVVRVIYYKTLIFNLSAILSNSLKTNVILNSK